MGQYTIYHCHSNRSLLDSCTDYKEYADRVSELGYKALALTEHGNAYNWVEKKMYINSKGLKYIHGVECYLTASLEEKVRDNYHTILLAKNYEGVKEIPGVKIYGDFSSMDRCAVVSLNIRDYDSGEVSDALLTDYGISTRSGGHCAPLLEEALGTVEPGAVRFSFSHYNTEEEVDTAIRAICELAEEE